MSVTTNEEIVALFKRVAKELMGESFGAMTEASRIGEFGIDSTSVYEIVTEIEDALDIRIPDEVLVDMRTVGDLVAAVQAQQRMAEGQDGAGNDAS